MKNNYSIDGEFAYIELVRKDGRVILTKIDASCLDRAKEFPNRWYAIWKKTTKSFYVYGHLDSNHGANTVYLHRWIFPPPDGMVIDHINHDTTDNTLANLRSVTHQQNSLNKKLSSRSTSGVRGVTWNKREQKWRVKFKINGRYRTFAQFKDFEKAKELALEIVSSFIA